MTPKTLWNNLINQQNNGYPPGEDIYQDLKALNPKRRAALSKIELSAMLGFALGVS